MSKPTQPNRPDIELRVVQKPVSVEFECPHCGEEISIPYSEFTGQYGDPPDWTYQTINCPKCEGEIDVSSADWD